MKLFTNLKVRSVSVGDVVRIDGRFFICEGIGWKEVPEEVAMWVVSNVTSRDFCHTLASTVKLLKGSAPDFVKSAATNTDEYATPVL